MTGVDIRMELIKICTRCAEYTERLNNYKRACVVTKTAMPDMYEELYQRLSDDINMLRKTMPVIEVTNDVEFDAVNNRESVLNNIKYTIELMENQLDGLEQIYGIMVKTYNGTLNNDNFSMKNHNQEVAGRIMEQQAKIQKEYDIFEELVDKFNYADDNADRETAVATIPELQDQYRKLVDMMEKHSYLSFVNVKKDWIKMLYSSLKTYWEVAEFI